MSLRLKIRTLGLSLLCVASLPATVHAADIEAGKAKALAVCAACHGANGISVSDAIPNLAGQRVSYLESLCAHSRKAGARTRS